MCVFEFSKFRLDPFLLCPCFLSVCTVRRYNVRSVQAENELEGEVQLWPDVRLLQAQKGVRSGDPGPRAFSADDQTQQNAA